MTAAENIPTPTSALLIASLNSFFMRRLSNDEFGTKRNLFQILFCSPDV